MTETRAQSAPGRERLLWGLQTAVLLLVVWVALNGAANLLAGAFFSLAGAVAGSWLAPNTPYPWRPLRLLGFFGYFLRKSWLGGIDVAWRALQPTLPINPDYSEYPLTLGSGLPRTVFVSIVSLLPGTLSVIVDPRRNVLIVHALTPAGADGLAELEGRVAWLFSLEGAKRP